PEGGNVARLASDQRLHHLGYRRLARHHREVTPLLLEVTPEPIVSGLKELRGEGSDPHFGGATPASARPRRDRHEPRGRRDSRGFRAWLDRRQQGDPVDQGARAADTLAELRAAGEV
ncbi:MAG TPA: hypothetical protein VK425_10195, partial [Acidimicrobiales bacterium]|nr:hypothetical protein [Acidimicrobiales bacterium]